MQYPYPSLPATAPDDLVRRLSSDLDLPLHVQSSLSSGEDVELHDGLRIGLAHYGDAPRANGIVLRLTVPVPPGQWTESFCRGLLRKTAQSHRHGVTLACDEDFNVLVMLTAGRDVIDAPDSFVEWVRQWIECGASRLADEFVDGAAP